MGGIVTNQILRDYRDLPIHDVVYMASASSVRGYEESVYPFLEEKRENGAYPRVYHLTLHPKAEIRERGFILAPQGSLLVWIDDFLCNPKTPREARW